MPDNPTAGTAKLRKPEEFKTHPTTVQLKSNDFKPAPAHKKKHRKN